MRILRTKAFYCCLLFVFLFCQKSFSQTGKINIIQDSRFEKLLNEKRKINSSITVNDRYKVQIFYGSNEEAKKTLSQFKKEFRQLDGTIVYTDPTFKVWVGTFKTRIEAERNYKEILKKYPNALLIRPNK
ncbi:SPOR domain-containing protein [Flavobacterium sp. SM15]|uniref:SPOR domain-containing protein n=1 Tax=Flavobacterium sp. SM15 TaxID=2908005 RepID=UPI001EDB607F|nr:SPOR domain-containing protein [Flavobacterium sp. SM15]MCG2610842.1 SPOR domain-containing protein [Flavobacterium sp. SM15]